MHVAVPSLKSFMAWMSAKAERGTNAFLESLPSINKVWAKPILTSDFAASLYVILSIFVISSCLDQTKPNQIKLDQTKEQTKLTLIKPNQTRPHLKQNFFTPSKKIQMQITSYFGVYV